MEVFSNNIQNYLEQHCDPEPQLLKHISEFTHQEVARPQMLSGHYQGRTLSMFSMLVNPKRILEIGTFTGYATLCLAEGLREDGIIHTIDNNKALKDHVINHFHQSGKHDSIQYHIGNATDILPALKEIFDLVFIDANKKSNLPYYQLVIDKVRSGGLVIIDNVLRQGKVLMQTEEQDQLTQLTDHLNKTIAEDQRVNKLILPVRDGLLIIRKK